jgi:hypothetical protein
MKVRRERFDEFDLGDGVEPHGGHYMGTTHVFELEGGQEAVVRVYDDEPRVAALVKPARCDDAWLASPAVRPMVAALREAGVRQLRLYSHQTGQFSDVVPLAPEGGAA